MESLNLKNQKRRAEEALDYMKNQRNDFFDSGEDFDALGECLLKYTEADLKGMNLEQLLVIREEMEQLGFTMNRPAGSDMSDEEYLKDMIIYFRSMIESENKLNEMIDKFDEEILKINDELEGIMQDYGNSVIHLMREEITNNSKFKETKMGELYESIMQSFDASFDLQPVLNIARELNPANTVEDYKRNKEKVYKQYLSVIKRLNVKHNLNQFNNVQALVTDKKYEGFEDFLIFVLMKFIAKRGQSLDFSKKIDGVFASQLCTNMYLLSSNADDEVIQGKFKDACKELLEIYLG
jgi:hypothetical protein